MFRGINKFIIYADVVVAWIFVGERQMEFLPELAAVLWPSAQRNIFNKNVLNST